MLSSTTTLPFSPRSHEQQVLSQQRRTLRGSHTQAVALAICADQIGRRGAFATATTAALAVGTGSAPKKKIIDGAKKSTLLGSPRGSAPRAASHCLASWLVHCEPHSHSVAAIMPACFFLAALAAAAVSAERILVLPPPRSISTRGPPRALPPAVISASAATFLDGGARGALASTLLAGALQRLAATAARVGAASFSASPLPPLASLDVVIASSDAALSAASDYSYELAASPASPALRLTARSVYGALAGLTTLSQLLSVGGGALPHAQLAVEDAPAWPHRGLMIDAGRRFFPLPLVKNLMDSMALVKLNLLHLHASDECRFGIESKQFPALQAGLTGDYGGFYTQADIAEMIAYGQARGVRVMLEVDVPGHSRGLRPLAQYGAVFCDPADPTVSQMYGDPANKTYAVLTALFAEIAPLFTEPVVHIGADETGVVGPCTVQSTFALERLVLDYIQTSLNKTPAGWEELLFDADAATPQSIIYAWSRHNPQSIISQGYAAVDNNASHFYLTEPGGTYPAGWAGFYSDIGEGLSPAEAALLQGGEMSQWTDTYCITDQCGASNGAVPVGAALFPPSADAAFATSIGGMIFPRSIVGATAFWNFNSSIKATDPAFVAAVWALNDQIVAAGGVTCPSRCECDQLTQCGAPILPPTPPAANMTLGPAPCVLPLGPLQSFTLDAAGHLAAAGGLCVANPAGGSGNPTYPLRLADCGAADAVVWQRGPKGTARLVDAASGGCLDLSGGAAGIYECGSGEGIVQLNQAWAVDASGAVVTLSQAAGEAGGCLTARAA